MTSRHVDDRRTVRALLVEGLAAGAALGALDCVAAGVQRMPVLVAAFSVALFALLGVAAGAVACTRRRRGSAVGLVFAGGLLLHGASLVSKELGPEVTALTRAWCWAATVASAAVGGLLAARLVRQRGALAGLLALWAVPASSLLWWALPRAPWSIAVALLCAGAWPAAMLAVRGALAVRALAASLVLALALPVPLVEREPPRRFVPAGTTAHAAADAPDVVLVLIDTLRADHVRADPTELGTHTLAALAAEGVRFENCVSAASWTLPSTSSILTSLYPSQHGAVMPTTALTGDVTTVAEAFHAAGYETAAFTGGAFVSPAFGLDQGFEYFDHSAEFEFEPFRIHVPLAWRVAKNRYLPLRPLLAVVSEFGGMPAVRGRVEAWLEARDRSRPYFLLVHSYQVHDYYIYHPEPDDRLREGGEALSARFSGRLSVHPSELETASAEDLEWFHRLYRERIRYVDAELGQLVAALRAHSGERELALAVTSDHGEGWDAERDRVHHGARLHDDLLHVPLVVTAPGLPRGVVRSEQVRTVDVMPTLLDLAGLPVPGGVVGVSLAACLRGDAAWPAVAFGEEIHGARELRALRTAEWKLIRGDGENETYRVADDPREARPLPSAPAALDEQLRAFEDAYPPRPVVEGAFDEATLAHLRNLGYIE